MPSRLLNSSVFALAESQVAAIQGPMLGIASAAAGPRGGWRSRLPPFRRIPNAKSRFHYLRGKTIYRALGAAALLSLAIAAPVQNAAAQDPVGGAILGGVTGGVIGGVLGGGRGAAVGAVVGGVTGAAIAAQGQPRPGGYRYYQQACDQQRGDGA